MAQVLLVSIIPREPAPEIQVQVYGEATQQVLRLLTRSDYDDTITTICVQPSADLQITVEMIVMTVQLYSQPGQRLLILHELPEVYWQILYIELMREIEDATIEPLRLEVFDVLELIEV